MENNTYYTFAEAVKTSEEIIGEEGILVDNAGTEWDCFNLAENDEEMEEGGECYWCVGYDGRIGYTEDNGYNVRWDYILKEDEHEESTESTESTEWLEKLLKGLKIGDLVAKNHGGFKQSMTYVVTEITEKEIRCRLLRNSYSENKLKMNKRYAEIEKVFNLSEMGSFPRILKLNEGCRNSDEEREKNINMVW